VKKKPTTFLITLNGLVQGVGFRPFVYQLANQFGIKGQVNNGSEGVKIWINTDEKIAQQFYHQLLLEAPILAKIHKSTFEITDYQSFENFGIIESTSSENVSLLLTPDFAMCVHCRLELQNPKNRRFRYPFITCTHCGPRYSIIEKLPYDRPQTTMKAFVMCKVCEAEYNNPNDRRFYAQTNACPTCGPQLGWYKVINGKANNNSELNDYRWILSRIKWALESGKILAIKGIGGYLLLCDATNEVTVNTLRTRKYRPTKPFAVMYPSLEMLKEDTFVNDKEAEALQDVSAPIVLLKQRKSIIQRTTKSVNPNLNFLGVMLPYSPLLELIAHDFGKPLVATSGNCSGNPIVYEDEKALTDLAQITDFIVPNNRQIVLPQDDSVIRFTEKYEQKIILRRSRGEILGLNLDNLMPKISNLSFGASLKSTFALQSSENLYVSQYLGDLESFETQENFENVLNHFTKIFNLSLANFNLICDAHEGYFSTQLAIALGEKLNNPVQKIQHHQAHFAAVLAENGLTKNSHSVLGVIWDGTGYGTDGNMWGGEFFIQNQRFHFEYFDAILGDKMPREPRISALCLTHDLENFEEFTKSKFSLQEWKIYQKILSNNTLKTSSVGRIFDGVASLLNLLEKQTFEGEAAMQLEELAGLYFQENGFDFEENYLPKSCVNVPTKQIFAGILNDINLQKSKEYIAAKFHFSLVQSVKIIANQCQINQIGFSGGVFQNAVLVDLLIHHLSQEFELFFHKNLSPNDENIAFGQAILAINFVKE
jgi:hydrogenase maturation protein HypF